MEIKTSNTPIVVG